MMSGRAAMLVFSSLLDVIFGALFILIGKDSLFLFTHGAVGVPMWAGIGLVVVGLAGCAIVLTLDKKRKGDRPSYNSFASMTVSFFGLVLASCIIGFYSWGAWSVISVASTALTEDSISLFSTVIVMAILIVLVSLLMIFVECCTFLMGSTNYPPSYGPRPRSYYDREGQYGPPPAHIYKQ